MSNWEKSAFRKAPGAAAVSDGAAIGASGGFFEKIGYRDRRFGTCCRREGVPFARLGCLGAG